MESPGRSQVPSAVSELILLERVTKFKPLVDEEGAFPFKSDTAVFSQGSDIFVSRNTSQQFPPDVSIHLEELKSIKVDLNDVFPIFDPKLFTLAPEPLPKQSFVKRQTLGAYEGNGKGRSHAPRELVRREAIACEALRQPSHPNIAKYFGCIVEHSRIVALCFQRYNETLKDRLKCRDRPLDKDRIVQGVRDGIDYMHSLGYCHNDIHDGNIMITDEDTPVIIDFDSCLPEGEVLACKGGAPWWSIDTDKSHKENDLFSLKKLEEVMEEASSVE